MYKLLLFYFNIEANSSALHEFSRTGIELMNSTCSLQIVLQDIV